MCAENVDFWVRAQEFRNAWRTDDAMAAMISKTQHDDGHYEGLLQVCAEAVAQNRRTADDILATFINEGAPSQVNIPFKMKEEIEASARKGDYPHDLFDGAQKEVYSLLSDAFHEFYRSDAQFVAFLAQLQQNLHHSGHGTEAEEAARLAMKSPKAAMHLGRFASSPS